MFKSYSLLIGVAILFAQGCSNIPRESNAEERNYGVMVYRQNVLFFSAGAIRFEFNGVIHDIGPGGVVKLKPQDGINSFRKISVYAAFADREKTPPVIISSEPSFRFSYTPNQSIRIGLAANEPTSLEKFDSNGKLIEKNQIGYAKSTHTIYASPNNVRIRVVDEVTKAEKIIYDNLMSTNPAITQSFPIIITTQKGFSHPFSFEVTWEKFDYTHTQKLDVMAGVDTYYSATPPETSKKYSLYRASFLKGRERIQFVCERGLLDEYTTPSECSQSEIAKLERTEQLEREQKERDIAKLELTKQLERERTEREELNTKLITPEGQACRSKLQGDRVNPQFLECIASEKNRLEERQKFASASASAEGRECLTIYPKNDKPFWDCHEKKLRIAQEILKDDLAKQCTSIGFEYGSNQYRDCYLKLKIHSEQIAEWRRLESAIQTQALTQRSPLINPATSGRQLDEAELLLDLANRGLNSALGAGIPRSTLAPPPLPVRIISPNGNSFNCSMMGAALRCR